MADIKSIAVRFGTGAAHRHITGDATLNKGQDANVAIDGEGVFVIKVAGKQGALTEEQKASLDFCLNELKNAFPDAKVVGLDAPKKPSAPSAPEQPPAPEGKKDATPPS